MAELTDYEYLRENPSAFVAEVIGVEAFSYQAEFMDNPSDRKCFVSGRQVGKSRTCAWLALHRAVTHPNETVLITADALRQSSELFSQIRSEMSQAGFSDDQWGVDRDTQTIVEFDNDSRILCLPTGRNGNKIRGYTADYIIVDEAAFIEDKIFEDVLEPMTFVTDGTIVLASTPWGTSGYFYRKATHPDWYSTYDPDSGGISSTDNPEIDHTKIEEFKEGKTRTQIKQEVEGEFVEDGSSFFPTDLIRDQMVTSVERETDDVYLGADIAGTGQDETVFVLVDGSGNVFSIEPHPNVGVIEAAKRINALDAHYGFEHIVIDQNGLGEGTVETLKDRIDYNRVTGIKWSTPKKQSVYQTLKAEMEAGNVVFPHDEKLRTQMENLGFSKTRNGNLSIQPKGNGHDDHPDALALGVWALPDTAGSGRRGARGTTEPVTLGQLERDRSGRRGYSFNDPDVDDDDYHRTTVVSTGGSKR